MYVMQCTTLHYISVLCLGQSISYLKNLVNELLQTLCSSCLLVVQDVAILLTYHVDMYVHGVCQWYTVELKSGVWQHW